jgi:hypothetical protein
VALSDPADQGALFTVATGGSSATLVGQASGNQHLVLVDFGRPTRSATIMFSNNEVNDGFTLDGAAPVNVTPVPLPASAALLLGAIAGLGVMRSRKTA